MKTLVIANKGLSKADAQILRALELKSVDEEVMQQEHFRIGIRNEFGLIYREIGIDQLGDFLEVVDVFKQLGFIDELGSDQEKNDSYDAVFNPGPLQ